MALGPLSRAGILAGRMLNSFRRTELLEKKLRQLVRLDQLAQQALQRALDRHLAHGIVSSVPASNTPAVIPITVEARRAEKTIACESTEASLTLVRVPDVVQVITAYRAWRAGWVKGNLRLFALGMDVVWEPRQKAEAECKRLNALAKDAAARCKHEAPDFDCHCGIWGFSSVENLLSALGSRYKPSIIGKVSLWGRVIETENGYRAQYAYPEELWAGSDSSSAKQLGFVYGVPVKFA